MEEDNPMDPSERITTGFGATDPDARPRRRLAESYAPSVYYENMLELKQADPVAWRALPPSTHIAIGMYEAQKAAHAAQLEGVR